MLKTTSAQLIASLDSQDGLGIPMQVGAAVDQVQGNNRMFLVPRGQVFLVTHVSVQADNNCTLTTWSASPNLSVSGIELVNAAGSVANGISFLSFRRWQSLFEVQDSPNWRNAPPGNAITWKPKYPIVVPSGWTVRTGTTAGEFGNFQSVYGVLVSEENARTLGISTSNDATASRRNQQVLSGWATSSAADLVPAKTGYSIRILDMVVRMQPETATNNLLTIEQTDGRDIFRIANDNPSDLLHLAFSPDIYLKAGQALRISSTVSQTATVVVSFEYVPEAEVPGDHWWSCTIPARPTPSVTKVGDIFSNITQASEEMTLYYPALDTTATASPVGKQHVLHGYALSIQKSTTNTTPDQVVVALSTGDDAGLVEFSLAYAAPQNNYQITHAYAASQHDQCVYDAVDDIRVPCKPNGGSIWVDAIGVKGTTSTPSATDSDIDQWAVTAWGRTVPTASATRTNRGV